MKKSVWAVIAIAFAIVLSACGGGGGSSQDVVVPTKGTALFTSAPSTGVTMKPGDSITYTVGGGGGGSSFTSYSVTTGNAQVVTATISGTTLVIKGVGAGTTTLNVTDSVGGTVPIPVTVTSASTVPLRLNAPTAVTTGLGATTQYSIVGGKEPYSVTSSNVGVATAAVVNNNILAVTSIAKGAANILVFDALGANVTLAVTSVAVAPDTPLFTTLPNPSTLEVASVRQFLIGGGIAPYTITSSNISVATVDLSGTTFTIKAVSAGKANIIVTDSTGASLPVAVNVGGKDSSALYTTMANPTSIQVGATNQFTIGGGVAPYTVASSNAFFVKASVTGSSLKLEGLSKGNATIAIFDATGFAISIPVQVATGSATFLFSTMPSALTLSNSASVSYTIDGGVAPYVVTTGNPDVISVTASGKSFTINALTSGTATVRITDAAGTIVPGTVTVTGGSMPTALYTTAPSAINIAKGATSTYSVAGGTGGYTASTSNSGVATVSIANGVVTINGVSAGVAQIVIFDSSGTPLKVQVTVGNGSGTVPLFSSAPGNVTIISGASATYQVSGGVGPYVAESSNVALATVSITATSFTINAKASGTVNVVVKDTTGAVVTVVVSIP